MPQAALIAAYAQTLRALDAAGVRFACIGSFGLQLHGQLPTGYVLHDADIVMELDAAAVAACHEHLLSRGWQIFLWDEPLQRLPDLATLADKYYLRARKGDLCLDIAFSGLPISVADILARSQRMAGIPVAACSDILFMRAHRSCPAD